MTAAEHLVEAERILAGVQEHLGKRGRKMGVEQGAEASLATAHATLAIALQGAGR